MDGDGVEMKAGDATTNTTTLRIFGVDIVVPSATSVRDEMCIQDRLPKSSTRISKEEIRRRKLECGRTADDVMLPPEMLQKIKNLQDEQSRDKEPKLLMFKVLSLTDVSPSQSRLLYTEHQGVPKTHELNWKIYTDAKMA